MYSVLLDDEGYFTGAYAEIGSIVGGVDVSELPPDMAASSCYKLVDNNWEFDGDKFDELQHEKLLEDIRSKRNEAFKLIDKYQLTLVYSTLSTEQKEELAKYRKAWLDAPDTLEVPNEPDWMI